MQGKAPDALPKGKAKPDGERTDGQNPYTRPQLIAMDNAFGEAMRMAGWQPRIDRSPSKFWRNPVT